MTKYLVVGAGLFGATFAHEAAKRGHEVKVIEKRNHIAGNIYTKEVNGIQVHQYGAHIFHTSNKKIWDYVNQFADFNRYTNSPVANYNGEIYNLPFNMNTFNKLWGVVTPAEAQAKIEEQRSILGDKRPENLEEQAISLIGTDIYEKLIKGYTEKQWGHKATDLPAFIIRRLPVRFTYDNNYFFIANSPTSISIMYGEKGPEFPTPFHRALLTSWTISFRRASFVLPFRESKRLAWYMPLDRAWLP